MTIASDRITSLDGSPLRTVDPLPLLVYLCQKQGIERDSLVQLEISVQIQYFMSVSWERTLRLTVYLMENHTTYQTQRSLKLGHPSSRLQEVRTCSVRIQDLL